MARTSQRYATVAILLHWTIAAAILFMIWLGWNMDENEARYQLHKSVGITILVLTVARVIWRLLNPPPAQSDGLSSWEATTSRLVHLGFYGLMIALPLTGWLLVSTERSFDVPTVIFGMISWPDIPFPVAFHPVLEMVHGRMAWLVIFLLGLHVAGAIKHEMTSDEGVLKKMLPAITADPLEVRPTRKGSLELSFGIALGAFALIALSPVLSGPQWPVRERAPESSLQQGVVANWTVDYGGSEIRFSGRHDGDIYSGVFSDWDAQIQFDPDAPDAGKAVITIQTGSATANKKLYTDSLKAGEWFDVAVYPAATAEVFQIAEADGSYAAQLRLNVKDRSVTVPFQFTVNLMDQQAEMTGQAEIGRKSLDLGQTSDPGNDWVDDAVTISVRVSASRLD
ncbi:MAG: cytochrome b/b6 domain-containing protein [Henriciella sp.]